MATAFKCDNCGEYSAGDGRGEIEKLHLGRFVIGYAFGREKTAEEMEEYRNRPTSPMASFMGNYNDDRDDEPGEAQADLCDACKRSLAAQAFREYAAQAALST